MDADIEQLLKSLNLDEISVAEPISQEPPVPPPSPSVFFRQPHVLPKKRRKLSIPFVFGGVLVLIVGIATGLFCTKGIWWGLPVRIVHVYESSSLPRMVPPFASATQKIQAWSNNDLACHQLPSGDLAHSSSFAGHLDILKAADERKKALEEVRRDVDTLMANCIHAPDMAGKEAFHRAVARFDVADVNLTHSLLPLVLSKRSSLSSPQEQQKFDETLSYVGLGDGLEEYSKAVVQIAATREFISQFLTKLREERDLCRLAETCDSALQLFAGLRKDHLMSSFIDLEARQKEAIEACYHSVEEALRQFPVQAFPRRCTLPERKAVSFLQGQFPSIDPSLFARVDGFLCMKDGTSRLPIGIYNTLGSDGFSSSTIRLLMAPEGVLIGY